jgi:HK97 family phage major capsid protein
VKKEVKAAPADGGDALMRAFEEFKAANDQRIAALEQGRGDVLLEEKVARIDRALTEQKSLIEKAALSGRRPALGADPAGSEHKSAWHTYLRRGDISALTQFEAKALSVGSDPDGGYVAPPELDRLIESRLKQVSPMRAIATVRTTSANVFKKPISLTAAGTGWVAETGARTQTATPTLAMLEFPTAELYANLGATQTLLGYPITEIEDMPDMAADSFSIAFGDFARGYLIVDRAGVRVLRDPYSAKPYVLFYVTKRVGGGVQNFDAIKVLKFGES